ncbi:TatD family hydrolase [Nitritalea halalkaliphila LW7]|uniref:TatD family hydrolase n=1 Tax=Nitritalea halalkaliphila LW7 TaxID=1189621 RepID=I5C1P5_9BACT|nr:TatD family hydrolase [Nitritalea halalkaliphila]EIM75747.1 TatD family hydrolase [Nitritalea halalkaliphila LW7]
MFTDTHAHLYSSKYTKEEMPALMEEIQAAGVHHIYLPNVDLTTIEPMLELAAQYPKRCHPMMGLHPCDVKKTFEKDLYRMEDWLKQEKFVGIGETGIDLYWDKSTYAWQCEALKVQAAWAVERQLPLILHCRESIDETLDLLEALDLKGLFGIFHCFTGNVEQANRMKALGFKLGIGGVVTYKNGGLDQVLPKLELSDFVLETDAPYLAPVPHRGKRNSPAYLPFIAQKLAALLQVEEQALFAQIERNVTDVFSSHGA